MPTQEPLSVWSPKVYLRHSILNRKYSLFRVKYLLWIGSLASATIAGMLAAESDKKTFARELFDDLIAAISLQYALGTLVVLVLLLSVDTIRCMSRLASDREKEMKEIIENRDNAAKAILENKDKETSEIIKNKDEQLIAKDLLITDQRSKARLDLITRIPNEIALLDAKDTVIRQERVLIMIDIVGFGAFNKSHSSYTANAVLREFAQFMFYSSRRVEHVYHLMSQSDGGPREIEYFSTVFRLHRKGDEFLAILDGGEKEALGFLTRLRHATEEENSPISLAGGRGVLFYAGIFAINAVIGPDECLHKVDEVLAHARQRPELGRVKWYSETDHNVMSRDEHENERDFETKRELYRTFRTDPYWTGIEYRSNG